MRQIVLDTETTGLEPSQGHKIIEIGCVELVNRKLTGNHYHQYINPEREIEEQAIEIHGITNEFVTDKPIFADIADEFMAYVEGADDSLVLARRKHPGQRNNLDALCKRYYVDNSQRDLHGALLDSEILADVYLLMTGGQTALSLSGSDTQNEAGDSAAGAKRLLDVTLSLPVIKASGDELQKHEQKLTAIDKASGGDCLWLKQ